MMIMPFLMSVLPVLAQSNSFERNLLRPCLVSGLYSPGQSFTLCTPFAHTHTLTPHTWLSPMQSIAFQFEARFSCGFHYHFTGSFKTIAPDRRLEGTFPFIVLPESFVCG